MKNFAYVMWFLLLNLLPAFAIADTDTRPPVSLTCLDNGFCDGKIQSAGLTRTFHYYSHGASFPNIDATFRIIFLLHDSGTNSRTFDDKILGDSFDHIASLKDFTLVYPDAYGKSWNFGPGSTTTVDDVAFINDLINYFKVTHTRVKIFVAGMGNGGLMVFRLGCELADQLTAIGVVDATMPVSLTKTCKPERALPLVLFEGRNDPYVPWGKNYMYDLSGLPPIATLTANETFNYWAMLDNLTVPSKFQMVKIVKYDGTMIYRESKKDYQRKIEVRLYSIFGGGHTWPGGSQYLPPASVGLVSYNLDASPVIVNFFYDY